MAGICVFFTLWSNSRAASKYAAAALDLEESDEGKWALLKGSHRKTAPNYRNRKNFQMGRKTTT
jgi:hypothetical protein